MLAYNGHPVEGLGEPPRPSECACKKILGVGEVSAPVAHTTSPWAVALTTSVVGAAAGWVIEEIRESRRQRR